MISADVYSLSIHADYRCRHSGACCSADWDVPVELPVYRALDQAVAAGRLRSQTRARHLHPFIVEPDLPPDAAAMLERTDDGECVFLESGTRLCIVHRDLGESALPATCRHFPRLAVRDTRGTFVTLSHFCPTAASMLFRTDRPLAIVDAPPAFPPNDYDGLVVTEEDLPPLLSPTMLMDLEGYSRWERHMVARCASGETAESVLATLWRDAQLLRQWVPGGSSLVAAVARLPASTVNAELPREIQTSLELFDEVRRSIPDDLKPPADEVDLERTYIHFVRPSWRSFQPPLTKYLAAKAFASWTAYQGRGLLTIVCGLQAALSLVRVEATRLCRNTERALDADVLLEAFRRADFTLNHLAVGEDLASGWSRVEA